MMIDNEAAIKVLRDINKTFADAGIVPYYNGPPPCKECDELQLKLQEARRLAEEFASEITRLRCNRTDTTAFSGRPKLPWEEK